MARERMPVSRSACLNCGRTDRLGFADETRRQNRYGIAVAMMCPCQLEIVSKVMQGSVPPGTRRLRFSKLRPRDRRLSSQLSPENIRALYVSARGRQTDARSECWRMLVPQLVEFGVVKLTIEQVDEGGKSRDNRDIRHALLTIDRESSLSYAHEDPDGKPMLWVADAVTWCSGAGGTWRGRIAPILYR